MKKEKENKRRPFTRVKKRGRRVWIITDGVWIVKVEFDPYLKDLTFFL